MTQPPARFENYPPDDSATPDSSEVEHTPVIRPYVPDRVPPAPTSSGSSRRTLIGLVIGIPIAGIVFGAMAAGSNRGRDDGTGVGYPYPPDIPGDPEYTDPGDDPGAGQDPVPADQKFSVGNYSSTVPDGWNLHNDGGNTVELTHGANRLTAVSIATAASTLAVDEIAHLAKRAYVGFTGRIGDPVDRSSGRLQHATMDGTGKFTGKSARLMVELWIDNNGSGLLVVRVLTAKVASAIAVQAQEMLDELSGDF